ncbi:MAG: rane-associated protein [Actinoplanes sp.]|jgi:membrane protein DedA with SNARE-associated domain|nr:rane-associated protein [Actinoplanes sp.]MDT5085622.1 rane-associated protein [Mycobacterium sp.]
MSAVMALPAWAAYLVVGGLVFGEAATFLGLVIPGETALLVGGAMAGTGRLSLSVLLVLAVAAAILGDSVGYEVGRRLGPRLQNSRAGRLVGAARWQRAELMMARRGGWAVLAGRWVGVLRALMPAIAGTTGLPYRRFLIFNAIGGTVWAVAVVVAAYLAGASWHRVQTYLGTGGLVVAGVFVAVVAAVVVFRRRSRRAQPADSGSRM